MSSLMRAALVNRSEDGFDFTIADTPRPQISPSEILVRLSATGVCGTDIGLASGKLGPSCQILGHEGIGTVIEVGESISPNDVQLGNRVGIAWVRDACGSCQFCIHPEGEIRCVEQLNSGRKINGTFAEYAVVPGRYVIRIPDIVTTSDEMLAPILCGGVTAYKGLKICGATSGEWVAILGAAGGVGALAIQYAKVMGFRVVAIDVGEEARSSSLALGAEIYLDVLTVRNLAEDVSIACGTRGVRAALGIAGSGKAYQAALEMLGPYGTLVCIGIPPADQLVTFHPLSFIDKGISIIGSAVGTRRDIIDAMMFVERGLVKPHIQCVTLDDLPRIAQEFGQSSGKYVIRFENAGNQAN